jgi:hypothetical protein
MQTQLRSWTTFPGLVTAGHYADQSSRKVGLCRVLEQFAPISLDEMGRVALMRRVDSKFILSQSQLQQALAGLTQYYTVLEIRNRRQHRYQTLYFDTPDLALYHQHHDGWRSRYKVRSRVYVDSHLAYLEVKRKTNRNVTIKSRLKTPMLVTRVDPYADDFLPVHYPYQIDRLEQTLWNSFRRITLVSKHRVERLTLDVGLSFWRGRERVDLPGVAIAEIKQPHFSLNSDFVDQMRALGVRPMRFSKYCIGVALLYDRVKSNRFKPQLMHIDRLMRDGSH